MATMIPADIQEFTTEGEKKFYKFLETVAKPDSEFLVWYTPDIEGKEPDFILFSKEAGLIVFEVKDWNLDQIQEANPKQFILSKGYKTEPYKNPSKQARDYVYNIMDKIRKDGNLISKDPAFQGKAALPIDHGVIFPNINKHDYTQRELDRVIETGKVFFWDDLHPQSDICSDSSGKAFLSTLMEMFPPLFEFEISGFQLKCLKHLLFPTVRIELPGRISEDKYPQQIKHLQCLDNNQEALARKYDGGHRIITGPSGSGKTLILVHKAAFLKKYNPQINTILFVCYNITLVNYIKRLLAAKKIPIGEN